jgi:diguanylate cyclase (GGDEF)-like protein
MMVAGSALAFATALLPPAAEGSEAAIFAMAAIAGLVGAYMLIRRPDLSDHAIGATAVLGIALITIATHEGGASGGTADNEVLYLWVCLYAFYFLPLPYALVQLGFVGGAYGWLLTEQVGSVNEEAITRFLVTMTTLVTAGIVISKLRTSLYRTMDDLSQQARHDGLTGVLNRSALEERVDVERARSLREGSSISLLAVDIDGFKALNDAHGHSTGDEVLRGLASALSRRTREMDAVGRVGGDEFAVLVPGAGQDEAQIVANDLIGAISDKLGTPERKVTVSIGVASATAPVPSYDELWRAADAAMYAGKRAGGNRVCVMPARRETGRSPESSLLPER